MAAVIVTAKKLTNPRTLTKDTFLFKCNVIKKNDENQLVFEKANT